MKLSSTSKQQAISVYSPNAGDFVHVEHVVFVPGAVSRHERKTVNSFITNINDTIPAMLRLAYSIPMDPLNAGPDWEPMHTRFEPYPTLGPNAWISEANHIFFVTPAEVA